MRNSIKKQIPQFELKKKYFSEIEDLSEIVKILTEDLKRIIEISNEKIKEFKDSPESLFLDEQQTWFRSANRLVITVIESICYKMKQIALLICDSTGKPLTEEERKNLTERRADGSKYFMKTSDNVKFSFEILAYAFGFKFRLKYGREWGTFLKVEKKRNKLTHPKTKMDLKITVTEHNESAETLDWFKQTISDFFDEHRRNFSRN